MDKLHSSPVIDYISSCPLTQKFIYYVLHSIHSLLYGVPVHFYSLLQIYIEISNQSQEIAI
jgi:hypothetical protein